MISRYERSLFEQQTPYLQWLKERERKKNADDYHTKGKQAVRLPFFSCTQLPLEIIRQEKTAQTDCEAEFILFYGKNGRLDERAEALFEDYFAKHADELVVYADEDYLGTLQEIYGEQVAENEIAEEYKDAATGRYRGFPWFKPEYSPDTLRSFFYFGNVFAVRSAPFMALLQQKQYTIYEAVLALTQQAGHAGHIAEVLFTNDNAADRELLPGVGSSWQKMKDTACKIRKTTVFPAENEIKTASVYTKEEMQETTVSIIIPSKDNSDILRRCVTTLTQITSYPHYEILIVDNGSSEEQQRCIKSFIEEIKKKKHALSIRYLYKKADFNFSKMCNLGASEAKAEHLLFLNDDIEIMHSDWLERMTEKSKLSHVGAVGAKLLYPKKAEEETYRLQHVGITNMGIGPAHKLAGEEDKGNLYHGRNLVSYNVLAVTGACLMVKRGLFQRAGGFDEELAVAYNDVELCFRLYEMGYVQVQVNEAALLHHESLSRGQDAHGEKAKRLAREKQLLYQKHPRLVGKDMFYSEHLVQWKKDVRYTCNYLYPYDKKAEPELLSDSGGTSLPKEHRNKLLRRLTGESRLMLQLDRIEVLEAEDAVLIEGWAVVRERDNADVKKQVLLKNKENGEIYGAFCYPKLRYDVAQLFAGEEQKRTGSTLLSGIQMLLDKKSLPKGEYLVGILMKDRKKNGAGVICWEKDRNLLIL